eukprot:Sspe_Gene.72569::Locus_43376_Transcript_1_1_Confidence_1.000_Length_1041::g.72569::m.72569
MESLGQALIAKGQFADAVYFLEKKLQIDPECEEAKGMLEVCHRELQRIEQDRLADLACSNEAHRVAVNRVLGEQDLYKMLEVAKDADDLTQQLGKKYRHLARLLHPDKNTHSKALKAFQRVKFAFETLSSPSLREIYDTKGLAGLEVGAARRASLNYGTLSEMLKEGARSDTWVSPASPPERSVLYRTGLPTVGGTPNPTPPAQPRTRGRRGRSALSSSCKIPMRPKECVDRLSQSSRNAMQDEFAQVMLSLKAQHDAAGQYKIKADLSRESCDPLAKLRPHEMPPLSQLSPKCR